MQFWASLVAQMVKRLPTMRKTRVWSLGREDPLEKEMATHSSILAWKISWTEDPGRLQSMASQSRTGLSDFTSLHSCSLIHQTNLISLTSLFLQREKKKNSLRCSRSLLWNLKVSSRSKRLHLEFYLGKLSKMSKCLNTSLTRSTDHYATILVNLTKITIKIFKSKYREQLCCKKKKQLL